MLGTRGARLVDAVAVVVVVALAVVRSPQAGPLGWGVAAALGAAVAARRWRPVAALVAAGVIGVVSLVVGTGEDAVAVAVGLVLHRVALTSTRAGSLGVAGALSGVIGTGVAVWAVPGLPLVPALEGAESFSTTPLSATVYTAVVITGAWALATVVRTRGRYAAELAESRTARAVAEERLRIARDVHDVVGHSLSLITMKAAVANAVAGDRPREREDALRTIEQVGRAALADVRTVLGAVRAPTAPALDDLVDAARSAGVTVTTDQADLTGAPAAVRISALRIAQEALTNVRRHSHPARCHLRTTAEPGALTVSVVDEGTTPPGPPGHGLLGIRERVALHGGTLHAGAAPGGGFGVHAVLPFEGTAPRAT
ncbi:histidine kinase [Actinokineospora sp. PR83]|uniref:sensor histidine kinase n=1 Tax=Actinokineospora sp. PR83 TaxID=2884908 RepID=UPI001F4626AC|nr:histidine kinase [Actinokineospora sp. PR83]MCG8916346.1 histidine kinase [Actinokineospora sp. PR83]